MAKHEAVVEGIFARIPLDELTLTEAEAQVEDTSWYHQTRMPVCFYFNVPVGDYWDLTVGDHREMVEYLKGRGLVDGDV